MEMLQLVGFFLLFSPSSFQTITETHKKKESRCLWSYRFWLISPESFELQKIFLPLLTSVSEKLSAGIFFFKLEYKISWFCAISGFFNKKLAIEKNPPFWKIQKIFLHGFDVCKLYLPFIKVQCNKCTCNLFKLA